MMSFVISFVKCLLPADKEVHRRVEVLVLHDSRDDQDVLQQRDDPQDEEYLHHQQRDTQWRCMDEEQPKRYDV